MSGWDLGLDYEETYSFLVKELRKTTLIDGERGITRRLYLMILLTQLRNGARLKEAIEFMDFATRTFEREGTVKGTKGKKRRMILPEEISKIDLLIVRGVLEERLRKGTNYLAMEISSWASKRLGINTYSLSKALSHYISRKFPIEIKEIGEVANEGS